MTQVADKPRPQSRSKRFKFFRSTSAPPGDRDGTTDEYPLEEFTRASGHPKIAMHSDTVILSMVGLKEREASEPVSEGQNPTSSSPLEAILLGRGRRQHSSISMVGSTTSETGMSQPKGRKSGMKGRFKSGPVRDSRLRNGQLDPYSHDINVNAVHGGVDEVKEEDLEAEHKMQGRESLPYTVV
jgi:hypothetical protein